MNDAMKNNPGGLSSQVRVQQLRYGINDRVRLRKTIEDEGVTYKKGSVGEVADAGVSAVSGEAFYTVNFNQHGNYLNLKENEIRPYVSKGEHARGPLQPPTLPADLAQTPKDDDKV